MGSPSSSTQPTQGRGVLLEGAHLDGSRLPVLLLYMPADLGTHLVDPSNDEIARTFRAVEEPEGEFDVAIVGAGPARTRRSRVCRLRRPDHAIDRA